MEEKYCSKEAGHTGRVLTLTFDKENFYHLLGFHKFEDVVFYSMIHDDTVEYTQQDFFEILAFTVVKTLIGGIWYFTFHFTLIPAVIVCILLLIVAAVLPVIALKVFNKGSIVEKLRVAE